MPDIVTIKHIADITKTSIESLVGYIHNTKSTNPYHELYKSEEYYWGTKPSNLCIKILEILPPVKPLTLLDIGCGEGKDAVFLARCGYKVSGFDLAESGIEKANPNGSRKGEKFGFEAYVFTRRNNSPCTIFLLLYRYNKV